MRKEGTMYRMKVKHPYIFWCARIFASELLKRFGYGNLMRVFRGIDYFLRNSENRWDPGSLRRTAVR